MKVFISWSGPRSHAVAKALHAFISGVLQPTRPWISSGGIDRGTPWFPKIKEELAHTSIGIICLTNANKDERWILFEAGAIAKLEDGQACTLLIDLVPSQVEDPLAQFQHTLLNEADLRKLLEQINGRLPKESQLALTVFDASFKAHWPVFNEKIAAALKVPEDNTAAPTRSPDAMISEILELSRVIAGSIPNRHPSPDEPFTSLGSAIFNMSSDEIDDMMTELHRISDFKRWRERATTSTPTLKDSVYQRVPNPLSPPA